MASAKPSVTWDELVRIGQELAREDKYPTLGWAILDAINTVRDGRSDVPAISTGWKPLSEIPKDVRLRADIHFESMPGAEFRDGGIWWVRLVDPLRGEYADRAAEIRRNAGMYEVAGSKSVGDELRAAAKDIETLLGELNLAKAEIKEVGEPMIQANFILRKTIHDARVLAMDLANAKNANERMDIVHKLMSILNDR